MLLYSNIAVIQCTEKRGKKLLFLFGCINVKSLYSDIVFIQHTEKAGGSSPQRAKTSRTDEAARAIAARTAATAAAATATATRASTTTAAPAATAVTTGGTTARTYGFCRPSKY